MLLLIGLTRAEIRAHLSNRQSDGKGKPPQKCDFFPTTPQSSMPPGLTRPAVVRTLAPCQNCPPFSATSATRSS